MCQCDNYNRDSQHGTGHRRLINNNDPTHRCPGADILCMEGRKCVSTVFCEPYSRATEKLRQLDRGSAEYRQLLARLKQQVCNRQLRRVCCLAALPTLAELAQLSADRRNSSSPRWVPTSDQCGLSADSAFKRRRRAAGGENTELDELPWTYQSQNLVRRKRVAGGEDTRLGEFPWMVLLRRERSDGREFWHCGGTLINKW